MVDINQTTECPLEKTYLRQVMTVLNEIQIVKAKDKFYVYGSVHRNIFYEITNRCSYMQSILFHC